MSKLDRCVEILKSNKNVTMLVNYELAEELYDVIEGTIIDENNKWLLSVIGDKDIDVKVDIYNQLDTSDVMIVEKYQYENVTTYSIESLFRENGEQLYVEVLGNTLYVDEDIDLEKIQLNEDEFDDISIITNKTSISEDNTIYVDGDIDKIIIGKNFKGDIEFDENILETEIENLIDKRKKAKENKDFDLANKIVNDLEEIGIILEDTPQGVRWYIKEIENISNGLFEDCFYIKMLNYLI